MGYLNRQSNGFLVALSLFTSVVLPQILPPVGNSGSGNVDIPPLPPIIQSGTFNSTHGEIIRTDVFGIKTYINQDVTYMMIVNDVTEYVCGPKSHCSHASGPSPLCSYECSRCHCDGRCHFYGDCCPHKLFEFSSAIPSIKPFYITCSHASGLLWGGIPNIYMVTKCPEPSVADASTKLKCNQPDYSSLSEATPVTDVNTQITYGNRFCADCHNIQNYQIWTQQATCPFATALQGVSSRDELWGIVYLDETCLKEFLPPPHVDLRMCYPNTHGQCNETGQWFEYISPLTEVLCSLYEDTVHYYGSSAEHVSYRNIFCAICNGATLKPPAVCQRRLSPTPASLTFVLQFNSSLGGESNNSSQCATDRIYDPLSRTCQILSCPSRRVLRGGECIIPYQSCSGLGFSFEQEFRPVNGAFINTTSFLGNYVEYFKEFFIQFELMVFQYFAIRFYADKQSTTREPEMVRVSGKFMSASANCSVATLETQLLLFLSRDWKYNRSEDTFTSEQKLCSPDDTILEDNWLVAYRSFYHDATLHNGSFSGVFSGVQLVCPFIQYNMSLGPFTYSSIPSLLTYQDQQITVNKSLIFACGDSLKICSQVIEKIDV